jgi:hypothetical protein
MACATPISNFEKDLNYQVCMICDSFIVPALLAYGDGGADTCALLSVVLSFIPIVLPLITDRRSYYHIIIADRHRT